MSETAKAVSQRLTAPAAASTYGATNEEWWGTYQCSTPSLPLSMINVHDSYTCEIASYYDNRPERIGYYSGSTDEFVLSPSYSDEFYAKYNKARKVGVTGIPVTINGEFVYENDYEATGDISISPKKTISSNQSTLKYVKQ